MSALGRSASALAPWVATAIALNLASHRSAFGHVAGSVDTNNRYVKLSPLGDRVRVVYTVVFGEVPGASARRQMDLDRDGQISEQERRRFGAPFATQIARALELSVDGVASRMTWDHVDVGLGTTATAAGAFAVDLVAAVCLASNRARHIIHMRDLFINSSPGETEITIEPGPGIHIERAQIGAYADPTYQFRFSGSDRALSDPGLELRFTAAPSWHPGGRCAKSEHAETTSQSVSPRWWIGVTAVTALGLGLLTATAVKRRRRAKVHH